MHEVHEGRHCVSVVHPVFPALTESLVDGRYSYMVVKGIND